MKTILLVRHAKSVNHFTGGPDFNRTLNDQGTKDAAEMAKRLVRKNILIDQFVSSPAVRARTTAEIFINQYNRKPEEILFIPELYHASARVFDEVVGSLDDRFDRVAIFSHNPGITEYAEDITGGKVEHLPTCAVCIVTASVNSWTDFSAGEKTLLLFDSPKAGHSTGA
ncbi:MAG TPA: histidine phosphatase family protein [Puia sp.]|nr:histidine phosphatase family protein [Puia sp.]